jgi:integrase
MPQIETRRRKDGSIAYLVRVRLKDGGRIIYQDAKAFDARLYTRKDALNWGLNREADYKHQDAPPSARGAQLTLRRAIDRYVAEYGGHDAWGRSKSADLARLLKAPIASHILIELRTKHLVDHVRWRRQHGAGPATAGNDLTWLRVLYKVARPAWGIHVDPRVVDDAIQHCREQRLIARAAQRERRPTRDELDLLLDWFSNRDERQQIPMAELILFALFSARREAEICSIRRDDYNAELASQVVRNVKDPRRKGVVIRASLTPEAQAILERQPDRGELFFPYNPKSVQAAFTRACKVLGIQNLHFHDLRHECASWLFELGWTIPQVAQVTGHRTWQVLSRYTHLSGPKVIDKYAGWKRRPKLKRRGDPVAPRSARSPRDSAGRATAPGPRRVPGEATSSRRRGK